MEDVELTEREKKRNINRYKLMLLAKHGKDNGPLAVRAVCDFLAGKISVLGIPAWVLSKQCKTGHCDNPVIGDYEHCYFCRKFEKEKLEWMI